MTSLNVSFDVFFVQNLVAKAAHCPFWPTLK